MVPFPKLLVVTDQKAGLLFSLSSALDDGIPGGVGVYPSSQLPNYILKSDLNPRKLLKWEVPMKTYPLPPLLGSPCPTTHLYCVMAQLCKEALHLGVSSEVEEAGSPRDFRELAVLGHGCILF